MSVRHHSATTHLRFNQLSQGHNIWIPATKTQITDIIYNKDNIAYNQSYLKNPNFSQHQSQYMRPS